MTYSGNLMVDIADRFCAQLQILADARDESFDAAWQWIGEYGMTLSVDQWFAVVRDIMDDERFHDALAAPEELAEETDK